MPALWGLVHARQKRVVLKVADFAGPDRRHIADEDELFMGRQLHHFTRGEQGPPQLHARDAGAIEEEAKAVPRVLARLPQLGRGAQQIGDAPGGAIVVGGKGQAHVAVVKDGMAQPVSFVELVETLRN